MRWISLAAVVWALIAGRAWAQAAQDVVTLTTGETLRGTIVANDGVVVTLMHPVLGELKVPVAAIVAEPKVGTTGDAESQTDEETKKAATPRNPLDAVLTEDEKPFWEGWERGVSVGLNASEGNTDSTNGRVAFEAKRETAKMRTSVGGVYVYSNDAESTRKSRFDAEARNDWILEGTRWRLFATGTVEYDQFADWDWRVTGTAGLGYAVVAKNKHELVVRAGPGVSQEFGGDDDRLTPLGVIGADYRWEISDKSRLFATVEYFPDLSEFREFRTDAKTGYEVVLDAESKLMLKVGAGHRHDSDPRKAEANDFEYFMTLGVKF